MLVHLDMPSSGPVSAGHGLSSPAVADGEPTVTHVEEHAPRLFRVPRLPYWYAPRRGPRDLVRGASEIAVVRAPAGTGKTLLVADAVREPDGSTVVWLDHASAPHRQGVWQTVADHLGVRRRPPDPHGAGELGSVPLSWQVDDVAASLVTPLTLVLDGFEDWSDGDGLGADVARLLTGTTLARVVVTSRRRTPFEDVRAGAVHDVRTVSAADLALERDDLRHVAARLRVEIDDPGLARLHAATGGHAAAARSVLGAAHRGELDLRSATFTTVSEASARYAVATLPDVDDSVLRAWERLAVPEAVSPALADRLLGDDARDALGHAEAHGIGGWSADEAPAFRLAPAVRTALRHRLRERRPGEFADTLDALQDWVSGTDDYLESLALAIERGDYALADGLAVRQSENLDEIGLDRLQRIVATVPRAALARHPFLGALIAIVYHSDPQTRAKGVEYFAIVADALRAFQASADPSDRLALYALESMALRWGGRGEAAARAARAALRHLDDSHGRTPIDGMIWHLTRQMAISLFMVGDVDDAVSTMQRAWTADRDDVAGRLGADARLALFHAVAGNVDLAESRAATLPTDAVLTTAIGIYGAASGVLARALTSLERGDLDASRARLRWLDAEMETNEMWPMHAAGEAVRRMLRGEGGTVDGYLEPLLRQGARCPTTPLWRERLTAVRALGALSTGRADEAHRLMNRLPVRDAVVRHVSAAVKMAEGRYAEALEALGRHRPDASPSARDDATHSLLAAVCAARTGSTDVARHDLERWAAVATRTGSRSWWLLLTAEDRALVRTLVAGRLHAWVDRLSDIPVVVPGGLDGARLSEREIVVLEAIAESGRVVSAARDLFVSPNTVKTQLRSIYRKLGVDNRLDALAEASRRGLLR